MGISSVKYKRPGGRAAALDRAWNKTYTLKFVVETTDEYVGGIAVRGAVDPVSTLAVPGLGDHYALYDDRNSPPTLVEQDLRSFVNSVSATEDDDGSGVQWTVEVQYSPYDASTFGSDPTLWPIRCSFGGERFERVVWLDQAGNAILNSAGDPFSEPITIDDSRPTITVTRNELVTSFSPTLAELYRDKVNDATWNGFPAKTVKCGIISTGDEQYDSNSGSYYYTVTYPFTIDRDTWVKKLIDQGFNVLDTSTPPKQIPYMVKGQKTSEPVPLDGTGKKLASNAVPPFVVLPFDCYPAVDFSAFNINLSVRLGL